MVSALLCGSVSVTTTSIDIVVLSTNLATITTFNIRLQGDLILECGYVIELAVKLTLATANPALVTVQKSR